MFNYVGLEENFKAPAPNFLQPNSKLPAFIAPRNGAIMNPYGARMSI